MLTLYRSNRAEFLAQLLAQQLLEQQPGPLETVEVLVNTWPTSRWLGEQLAAANGISSLVRFPFPGSRLRQLVRQVLDLPVEQEDPWRANRLVWSVLDTLPTALERPEAASLQRWLQQRGDKSNVLSRDRWQLARTIADAYDDYALYRPETLHQWANANLERTHSEPSDWQPWLWRELASKLPCEPFGLQVHQAIERLRQGPAPSTALPERLRLFGISALAPVQVALIQALSGHLDVEIYLLTPCPDLWQRSGNRRQQLGEAWMTPPDGHWLQTAPRLEATLGRMGAEFQQLLEGSGETQLGERREGDLFAAPVLMAEAAERPASLLEQLQQQLVQGDDAELLHRTADDRSLLFLAAPGPLREVQLVRDQILQWLAADPSLAPRDVLVMTPQIERYAPLLSSVFNDSAAIGIELPWRLTDRSQQSSPGLSMALLQILELAAGRLTASGLDQLLSNPCLQTMQELSADDAREITQALQRTGFRWGLDASERQGDEEHSLLWSLDRWLLGLVLPQRDGLVTGGLAPFHEDLSPDALARWWSVLNRLARWWQRLRQPRGVQDWGQQLRQLLDEVFGDGDQWASELQGLNAAIDDWMQRAGSSTLKLDAAVVVSILNEALSVDSGRFGHRSGALTISALEPMRAIPHRAIVLLGLDANDFPRSSERPGFHLLEQQRRLGDPRSSDQDRYVLLEALMSSRQHLMVSWCGRHERSGDQQPPAAPVEQWLTDLQDQLGDEADGLLLVPPANPLDQGNFIERDGAPPFSCDRRLLDARRCLEQPRARPTRGLAWPLSWPEIAHDEPVEPTLSFDALLAWLLNPQGVWLQQLGLHASESVEPVLDLEALQLTPLERHGLLDDDLNGDLTDAKPPNWLERLAGQGRLPAGSGGVMEDNDLKERWRGLHQVVSSFGPPHRVDRDLAGQAQSLLFAGDTHVVVQAGKLSHRGALRAWLQHLQLSCEGSAVDTALIARGSRGATAQCHLRWPGLAPAEAKTVLNQLQAMAAMGQQVCWPVPPRSGWQLVWQNARKPGSGATAFRTSWEDEQQRPALQLCFGSDRDAESLMEQSCFIQACEALYTPLISAMVPERRRRG